MRKVLLSAAALLGISMLAYWAAFAQAPGDQTAPQVIEISAKKYEFMPTEIHVKKGTHVELRVHSEDATHGVKLDLYPEGATDKSMPGLLFDRPDENGKVKKGVDQVLDFVAQEPGTYDFKCAKFCGFGHDKMKGQLIVDP
ncbi:MAG TPA: cupredoxin domain-containing protein [Candidatus Baltobacteraceae bacterium]|nr:cupredoxin domain-containing protein [Candidatus Baltobacteraceae bacterium]